MYLKIELKMKI